MVIPSNLSSPARSYSPLVAVNDKHHKNEKHKNFLEKISLPIPTRLNVYLIKILYL
ncbi:hypothetical protein DSUL_60066 [Desulfovibrionales bacterium]